MSIAPDIQNRVTLRPVTDAKIQAQDNGADRIGRGLQGLGAGVAVVADNMQAIADIHDEAAVKNADTMAMQEASALSRQIKNTRGEQALLAGEMFEDELQSIRERQLGSLKNDRQKRMFTDVFDRRAIADTESVNSHLDKETRTYAVDAAAGRAKTAGEYAVDNVDNPVEFDKAILTVVSEVAAANGLIGADKDMTKRATDAAVSGVYTSAVEKIKVEKGALAAEEFANLHASKISPDQETELRARMAPAVREERADNRGAMFIAKLQGGEYGNAIEGAAAGGEADPVKTEENAAKAADPLRGKGEGAKPAAKINDTPLKGAKSFLPKGGNYGASRDGGARSHGGVDYAAPEGTPVYPRTNGVVVETDTEGKTIAGYYVKIKYPDGHTSSMAHLRNINVKVGDQVTTDTVVGGVGGSGVGGQKKYGYHLHETVRGPDGKTIDPTKYKPSGVAVAGTAPGYVPKYDGERVNLEGAYADVRRVATEEGWSETEIRDVYQRIDEFAARQDKVRDRRYDDAAEVAAKQIQEVMKAGGSLTNPVTQISNFGDLDVNTQNQYLAQAEATKGRIASAQAAAAAAQNAATIAGNYSAYLDLQTMANTEPEKFIHVPLDQMRGSFPDGDWKSLKKQQQEFQTQGTYRPQLAPERSKIAGLVGTLMGDAGIDQKKAKVVGSLDAKKYTYLTTEVMKEVDAYQQSGTKMSDAEILERVIKPKLLTVIKRTPGYFYGTNEEEMPWYQAQMEGATQVTVKK